jgi:hypothetical protein
LRHELKLDLRAVRDALMEHLEDRLDEIDELLRFVSKDGMLDLTVPETLHMVQVDGPPSAIKEKMLAQEVKFSMADLAPWRRSVAAIERLDDRLAMFLKFARIEEEFGPLEKRARKLRGLSTTT